MKSLKKALESIQAKEIKDSREELAVEAGESKMSFRLLKSIYPILAHLLVRCEGAYAGSVLGLYDS